MTIVIFAIATKARSLKEDWIGYICREVLNVMFSFLYFVFRKYSSYDSKHYIFFILQNVLKFFFLLYLFLCSCGKAVK